MPKINEWVIPKNIDKPFETVYELKDEYKVPSFEEFMKDYQADEKVNYIDLGHGDIGVNKSYGPGNGQSSYSNNSDQSRRERFAGKAAVGLISGAVTKFTGPIPGVVYGAAVKTVGEVGHALSSSDKAKDAWKYTSELGGGIVGGAIGGGLVEQAAGSVLGNCSSSLVREGWEIWSEWGGKEKFQMGYHDFHLARGESYSSFCDVCKS